MWVCPECGERAEQALRCPRDGTELADAKGDTLLGETIGHFRIARLLGAGAMGRVYRAVQPNIGGRVAIKFLSEGSDGAAIERFFSEARAVNLIRNEHVVDVLDLSNFRNRAYIVMEHLEGAPLSKLLSRGRLPLGGLIRILCEVLDAIGAAHAAGIVHRDLKPDNIFISPTGHAKVLDFGIAKLAADTTAHLTHTGALVGTPKYMSPEQAKGDPCDLRADLYSLGVILYEACVGETPFVGTAVFQLLRAHIGEVPVAPRARGAPIPEALERVIMRALEKDPNARFQSAQEMAIALEAIVPTLPADEPDGVRVEPEGSMSGERLAPLRSATSPTSGSSHPGTAASVVAPRVEAAPTGGSRVLPIALAAGALVGVAALVAIVFALGTSSRHVATDDGDEDDDTSSASTTTAKPKKKLKGDAPEEGAKPGKPPPKKYTVASQDLEMMTDFAERPDLAHFDPIAWIPVAQKLMRRQMSDAMLAGVTFSADAHGQTPLTMDNGWNAVYQFMSANLEKKIGVRPCRANSSIGAVAYTATVLNDDTCSFRSIPENPACSLRDVLAKAAARGVTEPPFGITYMDLGAGVQWLVVSQKKQNQASIPDDCP